jgi:hypothetical protein
MYSNIFIAVDMKVFSVWNTAKALKAKKVKNGLSRLIGSAIVLRYNGQLCIIIS